MIETVAKPVDAAYFSPTMRILGLSAGSDVIALERWDDSRRRWGPSAMLTMDEAERLYGLFHD